MEWLANASSATLGLLVALISTCASLLTVLFTHLLARKRGLDEKLWTLRREAMSRILADLMWIQRAADQRTRRSAGFSGQRREAAEIQERMDALIQTYESNYLNLSRTFYMTRDDLRIYTHVEIFTSRDGLLMFANGIRTVRTAAVVIARREMPPPGAGFDFVFFAKKGWRKMTQFFRYAFYLD